MKTYEEIKKEELEATKGYSDKKLDRYIGTYKLLGKILDMRVLWTISALMFLAIPLTVHFLGIVSFGAIEALVITIAHYLYWKYKGEKEAKKLDEASGLQSTLRRKEEAVGTYTRVTQNMTGYRHGGEPFP